MNNLLHKRRPFFFIWLFFCIAETDSGDLSHPSLLSLSLLLLFFLFLIEQTLENPNKYSPMMEYCSHKLKQAAHPFIGLVMFLSDIQQKDILLS